MAICFLRHGESQANVDGVFAGQRFDSPLTDLGRSQARQAGRELLDKNITKIYSSPLSRAKETAQIVAGVIGYDADKIIYDDRITEHDMGSLTGTPVVEAENNKHLLADSEDKEAFKKRVLDFLQEHKSDQENILMVCHTGVGSMINNIKTGGASDKMYDFETFPNGHAVKLDLDQLC